MLSKASLINFIVKSEYENICYKGEAPKKLGANDIHDILLNYSVNNIKVEDSDTLYNYVMSLIYSLDLNEINNKLFDLCYC